MQASERLGGVTVRARRCRTISSQPNDGRSGPATTNFSNYESGLYDYEERDFLGFRSVVAQLPNVLPSGRPWRRYEYIQDRGVAGLLKQLTDKSDGGAANLWRDIETYDIRSNLPYRALNTKSQRDEIYGGTTESTAKERTFNAYGEVTAVPPQDLDQVAAPAAEDEAWPENGSRFR